MLILSVRCSGAFYLEVGKYVVLAIVFLFFNTSTHFHSCFSFLKSK